MGVPDKRKRKFEKKGAKNVDEERYLYKHGTLSSGIGTGMYLHGPTDYVKALNCDMGWGTWTRQIAKRIILPVEVGQRRK